MRITVVATVCFLLATTVPPVAAVAATPQIVEGTDTLSGIARSFQNDASKWPKIYEANKAVIKNPNIISSGMMLAIPGLAATDSTPIPNKEPVSASESARLVTKKQELQELRDATERKRREDYINQNPGLPETFKTAVRRGEIVAGMPAEAVKASIGEPLEINRDYQAGKVWERWIYRKDYNPRSHNYACLYIHIDDNTVTSFNEGETDKNDPRGFYMR